MTIRAFLERTDAVSRSTAREIQPQLAARVGAGALVWTLLAFAGAPHWALVPTAAALAGAALLAPPRALAMPALDAPLIAALGVVLLQLLPLPLALHQAVAPHAGTINRLLRFDADHAYARPLSIDPGATREALLIATLALATFWIVREAGAHGRLRPMLRAVAWGGLAVSVAAIVGKSVGPSLIFGVWDPGVLATPYGPFVNRNHMGTWLVLALPLIVGYIAARFDGGRGARAIDGTMVWLLAAAIVMLAALVISLSRSAAVGLVVAAAFAAPVALRTRARAKWGVLAGLVLAIGIVILVPRTVDLTLRFENSGTTETWARPQIWRETIPIVRDFPWTGSGAGSFATAMLAYQQSDRRFLFNQAHNQYLQLAAEGGLLLLLPLAWAAVGFARRAAASLASDRSPMLWIRLGALAGVVGVAVQSIWETGLRLPANAVLFAAVCAIAVHRRSPRA